MPPGLHRIVVIGLDEGLPDRGRDHGVLALGNVGESVAHGVNPASLPCRAEHAPDGGLQPFVRIGDDKLHAGQPTTHQIAQEARPERLGLGRADVQADDLALSVRVDGHCDYCRH